MPEIVSEVVRIVSGYGPFPFGILIGMWFASRAYRTALNYSDKEKDELREEKRQLRETIEAQQKRIDILHDTAFKQKRKIGSQ